MIQLRSYQEQAVAETFKAWEEHPSVLGCLPTGGGKTIISGEVIKRRGGRAMVLCHTQELVEQFSRSLWRFGLDTEIEKAELWAETQAIYGAPVVVATPQTLFSQKGKRLLRWKPEDFSLLIVDEGHHYANAGSFERVVKHFLANPDLRCLALTATPDRHDGIALARICGGVAFNYEIVDMIERGYLVGVEQYLVRIESLDLSKCRTAQGDLHGADLAAVIEQEKPLLGMADATLKTVGDKKTLVFAHSVKQAERLTEIFNRYRPDSAECVFGHTPDDKRAGIFKRFADHRLQILVNVAVAGEGYDNPSIEAIVCAKPTKSRARYTQQIGRGLRPLDGLLDGLESDEARREAIRQSRKPHCTVLDFVGNSGRHSLMTVADVLGGRISEEAKARAKARVLKAGRGNVLNELTEAERELREEKERRKRAGIVAESKHHLHYIDPWQSIRAKARFWATHRQTRPYSEKQKHILRTHGYNPDDLKPAEGQKIISAIFGATEAQERVLIRAGYSKQELLGIPKWIASKMIEACKQNGWRRPA